MNIFIPLIGGIVIGYFLRRKRMVKKYIDIFISVAVAGLIFLMGIKSGETPISISFLLGSSVLLAVLAIVSTLFLVFLLRRWLS